MSQRSISCFNCQSDLMFSRAYVPLPVRALAYIVFAMSGKSLVWPGNICKRCAPQIWLTATAMVVVCSAIAAYFLG